jgi:gliding motility-associated-like protein
MKKAFFIALCLICTRLTAQTITSDFNTNNDGWQATDSPLGGFNGSTYRATGGNPNGHISAKDILPLSTMYFVAPAKFLGNKSWAYNNSLSFDLKVETGTAFSVDDVIIEGNGVILVFDIDVPTTAWKTYTCPFNENSGWKVGTRNGATATKAQLQSVLCNISRLWIRAEYFNNFLAFDEGFLDNVNLGITACTPDVNTLPSKTICAGQSVTVNGKTYNRTGIFSDTIKRCFPQCDSIIKLNLTVVDAYRVNKDTTICAGNTFKVGSKIYNKTGIYKDTLTTANSCDSIVTLNLTVDTIIPIRKTYTICDIEEVRVLNKVYNQTGVYRDTFRTADSCTNVIISTLIVHPTYISSDKNVEICPNSSYSIGGNTYTQEGRYRVLLKTINGCDSIFYVVITIKNAITTTVPVKLCEGQSYTINNRRYERSGLYRDTFRTLQGCDSIVITDLTINPIYVTVKDTSICQGDFFRIGNKVYNQAGTYRDTLPTISNCDSVFITTLKIITPLSITRDTSICEGSFIRIGNKTYNRAGIYQDTLKGFKGCDSLIISINLKTITPLSITRDTSICKESILQIGNKTYSQAGVYRDTIRGTKGCDSLILTLNLTIKPERKGVIDTTICEGKTLIVNGKSYKNAGNFSDTIRTNSQCDSILYISIKVKPYPITQKNVVLCANDSAVVNGRIFTKIGVFRDTSNSATSCNEITEWTVVKSALRLNMGTSPLIELGDSIQLNPSVTGTQNDVTWTWTTNKALSCTNCPNPYARPPQTTIFNLSVRDTATNCTVKDVLKITVKPCESIFVPTAFSPNNDMQNDYLSVFASGCVRKVLNMRVFNRWGVLVFSQSDFLPNNDKNGWDGRMNTQQLPPDVYVYMIELELGDGTKKLVSGDVTLIR